MIGVVTNNFVDRTEEYSAIIKMALGLWYGRTWQKDFRYLNTTVSYQLLK